MKEKLQKVYLLKESAQTIFCKFQVQYAKPILGTTSMEAVARIWYLEITDSEEKIILRLFGAKPLKFFGISTEFDLVERIWQ